MVGDLGDVQSGRGPGPGAHFVDFENVVCALINEAFSLLREGALSATMEALSQLRRQLREKRYALVVDRGYADWEKIPATAHLPLLAYDTDLPE